MASIYEIALEAGVSPSTVARALRGTGYCSQENRERILEIAKRMNYIPSHAARSLKSNRTNKVLFCIPDIYNPFYFRMIRGVSDVLEQYDYLPLLCFTKGHVETELKMLRNLQEGYGDGMVFVSFNFSPQNISVVNNCNRPVVLTNNYQSPTGDDKFDCVYIDTFQGIYMACEHFIQEGFTHIGYIGGNVTVQTGRERFDGFLRAMRDYNVNIDQRYLCQGDFSMASGEAAMRHLLAQPALPEALVVANDLMAIGAYRVCLDAGIRVPEDIAIIGMDDSELANCMNLSSVQMCEEEIGGKAAKLLMDRILHGPREKKVVRLQPQLALRASSEKRKIGS
ncbi:MAG: LacI family transcriptional regulator [Eubacteriales bacterium]|nr:LacI family transcriptional regulator [Eubacteriales bacterium]